MINDDQSSFTETYTLTRSDQPNTITKGKRPSEINNKALISQSGSVFWQHPKFLTPLLLTWSVQILILLKVISLLKSKPLLSLGATLSFTIIVICTISLLTCLANGILLKMIQYERMSYSTNSTNQTKTFNLARSAINLAILGTIWGIIWLLVISFFIIINGIFKSIFGRWGEASSDVLEDLTIHLVELRVFAIIPAMVWENLDLLKSWKRSEEVINKTRSLYQSNYWTTLLFGIILGAPLLLVGFYSNYISYIELSQTTWIIYYGYAAGLWSFRTYLNQITVAQLYLCSNALEAARASNPTQIVNLEDINLPSLLRA